MTAQSTQDLQQEVLALKRQLRKTTELLEELETNRRNHRNTELNALLQATNSKTSAEALRKISQLQKSSRRPADPAALLTSFAEADSEELLKIFSVVSEELQVSHVAEIPASLQVVSRKSLEAKILWRAVCEFLQVSEDLTLTQLLNLLAQTQGHLGTQFDLSPS